MKAGRSKAAEQPSEPIAAPKLADFDDALRRLIRVPKAELDAEETKYRQMRKRLREKKAKRKPSK